MLNLPKVFPLAYCFAVLSFLGWNSIESFDETILKIKIGCSFGIEHWMEYTFHRRRWAKNLLNFSLVCVSFQYLNGLTGITDWLRNVEYAFSPHFEFIIDIAEIEYWNIQWPFPFRNEEKGKVVRTVWGNLWVL